MASKYAITSGPFDSDSTWSLNPTTLVATTVPSIGDVAVANQKFITINNNVRCDLITTSSTFGGVSGGRFIVDTSTNPVDIFADISGFSSHKSGTTTYSLTSFGSNTLSITASISGCTDPIANYNQNSDLILLRNTGTVNLSTRFTGRSVSRIIFTIENVETLNAYLYLSQQDTNAVSFNSYGTFNILSNLNSAVNDYNVVVLSASNVNVYGDLISDSNTGNSNSNALRLNNQVMKALVNIYGNIYGNSSGSTGGSYKTPLRNESSSIINIYGDIYSGYSVARTINPTIYDAGRHSDVRIYKKLIRINDSDQSEIIEKAGTGRMIIYNQDIVATNSSPVIRNTNSLGQLIIDGDVINASNGMAAIYGTQFMFLNSSYDRYIRYSDNGIDKNIYHLKTESLSGLSLPPVNKVRSGVTYKDGLLTGTNVIPPISSVALNVPVDDALGTAILTDVEDFFNLELTEFTDPNSLGYKVKNGATLNVIGNLIQSYNNI